MVCSVHIDTFIYAFLRFRKSLVSIDIASKMEEMVSKSFVIVNMHKVLYF